MVGDKYSIKDQTQTVEILAVYFCTKDFIEKYFYVLYLDEERDGSGGSVSEVPSHWRLTERNGKPTKDWVCAEDQEVQEGEAIRFADACGRAVEIDGLNVIVQICLSKDIIEVQR